MGARSGHRAPRPTARPRISSRPGDGTLAYPGDLGGKPSGPRLPAPLEEATGRRRPSDSLWLRRSRRSERGRPGDRRLPECGRYARQVHGMCGAARCRIRKHSHFGWRPGRRSSRDARRAGVWRESGRSAGGQPREGGGAEGIPRCADEPSVGAGLPLRPRCPFPGWTCHAAQQAHLRPGGCRARGQFGLPERRHVGWSCRAARQAEVRSNLRSLRRQVREGSRRTSREGSKSVAESDDRGVIGKVPAWTCGARLPGTG